MALMLPTLAVMLLIAMAKYDGTAAQQQLSSAFYAKSCPSVFSTVRSVVQQETRKDPRAPAALLRLHFHDCFVNGCDGSVLLDDQSGFVGEKTAPPNNNSLRGMNIIDCIKSSLEEKCPGIVSCADILAIAARDAVSLSNGPSWTVLLGRRDSVNANNEMASRNLPGPSEAISSMANKFQALGLTLKDMVTLSGAHSIGHAQCRMFAYRLYNFHRTGQPDPTLDPDYLTYLQGVCPKSSGNPNAIAPLEHVNVNVFSNQYYRNLVDQEGLLQSDQELFSVDGFAPPDGPDFQQSLDTQALVEAYADNQNLFFSNFRRSMVKMGNLSPLTGSEGQVRKNCRMVNS